MTNKQTHWTNAQNPIHFKPHNSVSLQETLRNRHTLFGKRRSSFSWRLCSVLPNAELLEFRYKALTPPEARYQANLHQHTLRHTKCLRLTHTLSQSFYTLLAQSKTASRTDRKLSSKNRPATFLLSLLSGSLPEPQKQTRKTVQNSPTRIQITLQLKAEMVCFDCHIQKKRLKYGWTKTPQS